MKKLIKLTLLAVFLGIHPVSCDKENDCNPGKHAYHVSNVKIESKDLSNSAQGYYQYYAPLTDTINYYHIDSVGTLITLEFVDIAYKSQSNFSGFQSSATACSFSYNYEYPIKKMDVIYTGIGTQFNNSIELNTGDTITSMFNFSRSYSTFEKTDSLENIGNTSIPVGEDLFIMCSHLNTDSLLFQCYVSTTLTDGTVIKSEDVLVKLLPVKP